MEVIGRLRELLENGDEFQDVDVLLREFLDHRQVFINFGLADLLTSTSATREFLAQNKQQRHEIRELSQEANNLRHRLLNADRLREEITGQQTVAEVRLSVLQKACEAAGLRSPEAVVAELCSAQGRIQQLQEEVVRSDELHQAEARRSEQRFGELRAAWVEAISQAAALRKQLETLDEQNAHQAAQAEACSVPSTGKQLVSSDSIIQEPPCIAVSREGEELESSHHIMEENSLQHKDAAMETPGSSKGQEFTSEPCMKPEVLDASDSATERADLKWDALRCIIERKSMKAKT
jgi:hypothetical protein